MDQITRKSVVIPDEHLLPHHLGYSGQMNRNQKGSVAFNHFISQSPQKHKPGVVPQNAVGKMSANSEPREQKITIKSRLFRDEPSLENERYSSALEATDGKYFENRHSLTGRRSNSLQNCFDYGEPNFFNDRQTEYRTTGAKYTNMSNEYYREINGRRPAVNRVSENCRYYEARQENTPESKVITHSILNSMPLNAQNFYSGEKSANRYKSRQSETGVNLSTESLSHNKPLGSLRSQESKFKSPNALQNSRAINPLTSDISILD